LYFGNTSKYKLIEKLNLLEVKQNLMKLLELKIEKFKKKYGELKYLIMKLKVYKFVI